MSAGYRELVEEFYPGIPDKDAMDLLVCATCFPFGTIEIVRRHLQELIAAGATTVSAAIAHADAELDREWAIYQQKIKEEEAHER